MQASGIVHPVADGPDEICRRSTEVALRESETRYRTLAEAAHDSIFIVDADARLEYANAVSCDRFQRPCDEVVGKRLHDLLAPAAADEIWRHLSVVVRTKQRHYFESCVDLPSGPAWFGTWAVPLRRGADEPTAVMGVARDITDRKQLEREFTQAQKMEAVGRLAGGIAHDFNNLLTAILGYSEMLLDELRDQPALAADVDEIHKAGERAKRLTRQLLAFSRKQEYSPKTIDVNELIRDLEKLMQRVIGEDVRLGINTDPQLLRVTVDPGQLEQVLLNLVVNARDAMPRGGSLTITTSIAELGHEFVRRHEGMTAGSYAAIAVTDTGCGMTADVLAHVFEPFFTTKPEGQGTGLGLSTVYGIVKQSGGCVAIHSQAGAGSTFTVHLPIADQPFDDVQGDDRETAPASGNQTILVVEDEPGLLRLMHRTLEQRG